MGYEFGRVMFGEASRRLQAEHGSLAQYDRMIEQGGSNALLGYSEAEFLAGRDSFYLASVTPDGWPYVQHRGGPKGVLRVLDAKTLAFADYSGNKQYITAGNLETNDRVALFLMDYPEQARLKVIGHAQVLQPGQDQAIDAAVKIAGARGRMERIILVDVVAFDWNCSQHITPRFTREEFEHLA